jgi:putative restriction endonuclease
MRYWWVNQNQTYQHEVRGGYLWSPKVKANLGRNPYYDFMREVAPGDIVFSFANTRIAAIGHATSHAYEAPKPIEFGNAGAYWDRIGWRVDVSFATLSGPIRPADHIQALLPVLPKRYSPLRPNGAGLQNVYLTLVPQDLAVVLIDLIGVEGRLLASPTAVRQMVEPSSPGVGLLEWEEHEALEVQSDATLPETEKKAVILARRGQGLFKQRVMQIEKACRITGVTHVEHLRASHCKPWRDADNVERLDGENGLLLTPNADHLFDRGFISFEDSGDVLISPVAHLDSLSRLGLSVGRLTNVGPFSEGQQRYLEFHRENVLLRSRYLA